MSLQTRLEALAAALGADIKTAAVETYVFSMMGPLTVKLSPAPIYVENNYELITARASVGTAPVGASIIANLTVNGVSYWNGAAAQRPTILDGTVTDLAGPPFNNSIISAGSYLNAKVDQIGSTTAGSDLTLVIRLRRIL